MNASRLLLLLPLAALVVVGCGSSRITVDGYNDAMLSNRTLVVALPPADLVALDHMDYYAEARGSAGAAGRELLEGDLANALPASLSRRFDSNTVAIYSTLPVSGSFPIHPVNDFEGNEPKFWDKMKSVGREGKFDYQLVMKRLDITSTPSSSGGRGREGASAEFVLLDVNRGRVMTSGTVSVGPEEIDAPESVYARLATEISRKLPFHVRE